MIAVAPQRRDKLGGTPTSTRTTATLGNVMMTVILLFTLPPFVYYLWWFLAFNRGRLAQPSVEMLSRFPLPTAGSGAIVAGWLTFQGLLQIYAPGRWVEGTPLPDGARLKYKMNGWFAWWFTWLLLAAGAGLNLFSPAALADRFGALLTTANIFTYLFSFYKKNEVEVQLTNVFYYLFLFRPHREVVWAILADFDRWLLLLPLWACGQRFFGVVHMSTARC